MPERGQATPQGRAVAANVSRERSDENHNGSGCPAVPEFDPRAAAGADPPPTNPRVVRELSLSMTL